MNCRNEEESGGKRKGTIITVRVPVCRYPPMVCTVLDVHSTFVYINQVSRLDNPYKHHHHQAVSLCLCESMSLSVCVSMCLCVSLSLCV